MKLFSVCKLLSYITILITLQSHATQNKLLPKDGRAEDNFAFSVAIDGDTALVGAFKADTDGVRNSGAAYVYSLGIDGWQQRAKLVANPGFAEDTLGGNVALNSGIAMLGASRRDDKGEDSGAVLVFEQIGDSWSQKQILTAPDAKAGDAYGQSIALTDKFLVIGAPHSDAPLADSGSAYVYWRQNQQWHFHSKLVADDSAEGDLFGISVAIDGDTLLVGADLKYEKAAKAGAVYAYQFDGEKWQQQAKLTANDPGNTDIFGVRVALSGDTALISARRDDVEGVGVDAGSAYIFERSKGQWRQTQKLLAPDGKADDRFARGVALNGDTALISAMHHDTAGNNAGAVYLFKEEQGQWRYHSKICATDGAPEDRFGWNLALSGKTAIIATPHRDDNGNNSGAAYIIEVQK